MTDLDESRRAAAIRRARRRDALVAAASAEHTPTGERLPHGPTPHRATRRTPRRCRAGELLAPHPRTSPFTRPIPTSHRADLRPPWLLHAVVVFALGLALALAVLALLPVELTSGVPR